MVIKTPICRTRLYIFDCFCFEISCFYRILSYARTEILTSDAEKSALSQDEGNVVISQQQQKVLRLLEKKKGAMLNSGTLFIGKWL